MSLAVAMMKIEAAVVLHPGKHRAEDSRCESPPSAESALAEANAFSISSTQKTTGDIASACVSASRSRASVSPTNFW